jgi:hypothetical protein
MPCCVCSTPTNGRETCDEVCAEHAENERRELEERLEAA